MAAITAVTPRKLQIAGNEEENERRRRRRRGSKRRREWREREGDRSRSIDAPWRTARLTVSSFHPSLKYASAATAARMHHQSPRTAFPISRESPRLRRFTCHRDTYYRKFERTCRGSKESLSIRSLARGNIAGPWAPHIGHDLWIYLLKS